MLWNTPGEARTVILVEIILKWIVAFAALVYVSHKIAVPFFVFLTLFTWRYLLRLVLFVQRQTQDLCTMSCCLPSTVFFINLLSLLSLCTPSTKCFLFAASKFFKISLISVYQFSSDFNLNKKGCRDKRNT